MQVLKETVVLFNQKFKKLLKNCTMAAVAKSSRLALHVTC